jgi:two-component sensor histidine kinase
MSCPDDNRDVIGGNPSTTLVSEAHHRIANNLAAIAGMVRLQAHDDAAVQRLRNPAEVRSFLAQVEGRIETAAKLHRMLAQAERTPTLRLSEYLPVVVTAILAANAADETTLLEQDLDPYCLLPPEQGLAVALIVAELIANALKYAHPTGVRGKIALRCRRRDGGVIIEVADDGVGLPEGFDPETASSLGFRLMRGLAHQLGARLSFDQGGLGLCARLSMP